MTTLRSVVGCRVPPLAARLPGTFYVAGGFGRRVAPSLAPEAGATSADRILPGFGDIVTACWAPLLLRTSFVRICPGRTAVSTQCGAARFGYSIDPGYYRASPGPG